jgi:alpha-aminoadipate carrier protein LysW
MKGSTCPDCGASLEVSQNLFLHEIISCPSCGLELEIISILPIKLQELVIEGEDWGE